jgi:HipA-like protein
MAEFSLRYSNLEIGRLSRNEKGWIFSYGWEFRNQDRVSPLTNFPNKEKIYYADDLWPFFASRIPSLKQPQVRQIIREEQIDANDESELLSRFGRESISNPFKLVQV